MTITTLSNKISECFPVCEDEKIINTRGRELVIMRFTSKGRIISSTGSTDPSRAKSEKRLAKNKR